MFERKFKKISEIINAPLFKDRLKDDVLSGKVFPAFRKSYMDFYHMGGRLFNYKNGVFRTHYKYASVLTSTGDYVSEADLKDIQKVDNFRDGYEQIKGNCAKYSGVEDKGISDIYHKHSYANSKQNVVVLDIEASFGKNRIDLLLFNKTERKLRFYEAKHFTNSELWSKAGSKPKVVKQILKYKKEINDPKNEILTAYSKYVGLANDLFGLNLDKPVEIDHEVALLLFGFDANQRDGRLKDLLLGDGSLEGLKYYAIGEPSKITNLQNAWNLTDG